MKRKILCLTGVIGFSFIILFFCLYTRKIGLPINDNTKISIEYNNKIISLSYNEKIKLEQILSNITIYRPIFLPEYPYHNESTCFIRVQNNDNKDKLSGVLTICIDDPQNSTFEGMFPRGKFKIDSASTENLIALLEMTEASDSAI